MAPIECPVVPNFDDLGQFLIMIGGATDILTGFFLDPHGKKPIPGYGCVNGNLTDLVTLSKEVWEQHQGSLHICLNRTDLLGRKKKNIQSCYVFAVDLDHETSYDAFWEVLKSAAPHFYVESSPNKFHLYWYVEGFSLLEWKLYQEALAYGFDGDPNLGDITKTLRCPGLPRITKEGNWFVPTYHPNRPLLDHPWWDRITPDNLLDYFPFLPDALEAVKENSASARKEMKRALRTGDVASLAKLSRAGTGRNATVFSAVKLAASKPMQVPMSEEEAISLAGEINQEFDSDVKGPLEEEELQKVALSGLAHGLELRETKLERIREHMEGHIDAIGEDRIAEEAIANGGLLVNGLDGEHHDRSVFPYDYTAYDLRDRFNDTALLERTLQRFSRSMIRVGETIYAFDQKHLVWRKQRVRGQQEIIKSYVRDAQRDTIVDPDFIESQCLTSEGEFSESKRNQAINKFMSSRLNYAITGDVFGSEKVPRGTLDQFDRNPHILHVANGVLNLETLELEEASDRHLFLHQSDVAWNPQADFSWWENYLNEVFAQNEDPQGMVNLMWEIFGYSLTGSVEAQKIFIHYGLNLNGKSKILEALRIVTGEYSTMVMGETMTRRENAIQKEFERIGAKVEGKRLVVIDDLDIQTQWNESAAKVLTGPRITARKLYEEERDIPNRAKFHIGCNQPPKAEGTSAGILRRLCIIPYRRIFEQSTAKEHEIRRNLQLHKEGILLWAAMGAQQVIKNNWDLNYPAETETELEEYRQVNFVIEGVIHELFKQPIDNPAWYSNDQLLKILNDEARSRGGLNEKIDAPMLGRILKDRLGIESKRVIDPNSGKKKTFYLLENCSIKSE